MGNCQKYKPTYILIAINIAVYIYTSWVGGNFLETGIVPIYQWGQVGALVYQGWYYQLITSMFVHASIVHIAGNMIFLLIFGLRGEELFSLPEYLLIYLGGGLVGNLLSLVFLPSNVPSVGASGAIFAMFGGATIYARRTLGQSILGALIYAFFLLFISYGQNVNIFAHLGGLGAGLLIGYALSARRRPQSRYSITYSYGHRS
jgi:membrane associated rhomboid family serine protease